MSFPRYENNKDSGVEWLGKVPAHWEVRCLKRNLGLLTHKTTRRENLIALENIESWSGRFVATETEFEGDGVAFEAGDILFGKLRPYLAKVYLATCSGAAVGDFHVMRPAPSIIGRFAQYQLINRDFIYAVDGSTFGSKMPRASWEFVSSMPMATPPVEEQRLIASFLDRETAKIEGLIGEQRRLIELLKEKRQSVISHAVTKGLDAAKPMKDCGAPWLGSLPTHWETRRIKGLSSFVTSGPRGWSERISDEGALFVQSGDLNDELSIGFDRVKRVTVDNNAEAARTKLAPGDVVVCITGAKTGNVAVCGALTEEAYINQHLCLIRSKAQLLPAFLGLYLACDAGQAYFALAQYGLKQGLSLENVRDAVVPLPPLDEQERIVALTLAFAKQISSLVREAERAVTLLQERRICLISAAVTGQIDVRGAASASALAEDWGDVHATVGSLADEHSTL